MVVETRNFQVSNTNNVGQPGKVTAEVTANIHTTRPTEVCHNKTPELFIAVRDIKLILLFIRMILISQLRATGTALKPNQIKTVPLPSRGIYSKETKII